MCLSTGCGFCLSLALEQRIKIIFQTLYLWGFIYFTSFWLRHRRRSRGAGGSVAPSNKKMGRAEPPTFWAEKHGCIWQYLLHQRLQSAHFLSSDDSRTTQEAHWRRAVRTAWTLNCILMRCHKSITDTLNTLKIARANEQRKGHFGE